MNDQFSKIINQLKKTLTEKEKEKRNLDNQINRKDNEIEDVKQKIAICKSEENELKSQRNKYKYYPFKKLVSFFEFFMVGLGYPVLLSMIKFYYKSPFIEREQRVRAGLVPPMSIEEQIIWCSISGVLAFGTIFCLTKKMKDLMKEKKDLDSVYHNYSSLEEIDDLIHNKAREHQNLENLLSQLIKEKNSLICNRDFILLSIDTLKEKITMTKDMFVEACSYIINEEVENNLNACNNQVLLQEFSILDAEEEKKKSAILARVKSGKN